MAALLLLSRYLKKKLKIFASIEKSCDFCGSEVFIY